MQSKVLTMQGSLSLYRLVNCAKLQEDAHALLRTKSLDRRAYDYRVPSQIYLSTWTGLWLKVGESFDHASAQLAMLFGQVSHFVLGSD